MQELNILVVRSKTKNAKSTGDVANIATTRVQTSKHKTQSVDPKEQKYQWLH